MNRVKSIGSITNQNIQIIEPASSFIFEKNCVTQNKILEENTSDIKISNNGIYVINFIIYLKDYGEVALFKNDKIIENSITKSNLGTNIIFMHQIIFLKEKDVLTLRNVSQNLVIIFNPNNKINLELIICKI
jgi:hypothetical protein